MSDIKLQFDRYRILKNMGSLTSLSTCIPN